MMGNLRSIHSVLFAAPVLAAPVLAAIPAAAGPFEDAAAAEAKGDYSQAFKLYQAASKKGSNKAKLAIGNMYMNSRGVKKDPKKAIKWVRQSANAGNVTAQRLMGVMYDGSLGIKRDKIKAYKWYGIAAAHGDSEAHTLQNTLKYRMNLMQLNEAQRLVDRTIKKSKRRGTRSRRNRRRR
jgi:TPR repeat protein